MSKSPRLPTIFFSIDSFPTHNLEKNYCRNPSENEGGAWCYTLDGPRFEFCDIPACEEEKEEG